MSDQSGTAGKVAGKNKDAEPKVLGVDDIPGAVSPGQALEEAAPASAGGQAALNERLAAFRQRRAASGVTAGGGAPAAGGAAGQGRKGAAIQAMRARGGGAGGAAGGGGAAMRGRGGAGGAKVGADLDPIAAGRKMLEQLQTRLADAGDDKRPVQYAVQAIAKGYSALEEEVARLRHELERAHEAVRTVQREGD